MVNYRIVEQKVECLVAQAAFELAPDVLALLRKAYNRQNQASVKQALAWIIDNAQIAKQKRVAICQDTGLPVVFIQVGKDVVVTQGLIAAIQQGIVNGYRNNYLRASLVDPLTRGSSFYGAGELHLEFMPQARGLKISILPKGFGSENKSVLKMFNPTANIAEIIDFIVSAVEKAGPESCPPFVVGVGIGATADKALLLAKKALLLDLSKANPDKTLARLETKLLMRINRLNIGPMGFGGRTTALAVKVLKNSTHIAGLPVGVNISCHALRKASIVI